MASSFVAAYVCLLTTSMMRHVRGLTQDAPIASCLLGMRHRVRARLDALSRHCIGPPDITARQALARCRRCLVLVGCPADWASTTTNSSARRFTREFCGGDSVMHRSVRRRENSSACSRPRASANGRARARQGDSPADTLSGR